MSLKRLYRRREVVLPLQWPYASGVKSSSGLALLRGETHRSGNHASMRRQCGLVLLGDRQHRRCTYSGRPLRSSAQADRCNDGYLRCHPCRSTGFGLPHLYVHNDAALCSRSGIETSQSSVGAGPAQSCWPSSRRFDAAHRMAKLRWRWAIADASRAHARRIGSVVHQNFLELDIEYRVVELQGWRPDAAPGLGWPLGERAWINPSPETRRIYGWRAPMRAR